MGNFVEDAYNNASDAVTTVTNGVHAVTNPSKSGINGLLDAYTQYVTAGFIGVNGEGGLKMGYASRAGDEVLGSITGRNVARKALMDSNAAADQAKVDQAKAIKDQQTYNYNQDTAASQTAAAIRATTAAQAAHFNSLGGSSSPGRDFMGLS